MKAILFILFLAAASGFAWHHTMTIPALEARHSALEAQLEESEKLAARVDVAEKRAASLEEMLAAEKAKVEEAVAAAEKERAAQVAAVGSVTPVAGAAAQAEQGADATAFAQMTPSEKSRWKRDQMNKLDAWHKNAEADIATKQATLEGNRTQGTAALEEARAAYKTVESKFSEQRTFVDDSLGVRTVGVRTSDADRKKQIAAAQAEVDKWVAYLKAIDAEVAKLETGVATLDAQRDKHEADIMAK